MKNKEKPKYLYKKVVMWEKKPKCDGLIGGFIFCLFSFFMICLLFYQDKQTALLTLIFSLLLVFGVRLIFKSVGKEKKEYYMKTKLK